MIDIATQIGAIERAVKYIHLEDGGEGVSVVVGRRYAADAPDVWEALTDPARLVRWFLPVRGELTEGGHFQLEGNAGGTILECSPTSLLRVTFGDETSIVELRLTGEDPEHTVLELEHTVPLSMAQSGAGALWVGPGWDGALMSLGLYLEGIVAEDPVAAANSPETVAFNRESVHAWAAVVEASGTATPEQLAQNLQISLDQFAPGAAATTEGDAASRA